MALPLNEFARRINGSLLEDPSTPITCFALLERALSGDVSFLPDVRFKAKLRWWCASAVIVDRNLRAYCTGEVIIVGDILVACVRAAVSLEHRSCICEYQ